MAKKIPHVITKEYGTIKGWSTASKYVRPFNVCEDAVNLMRLADGTHSPRRGYQAAGMDIGGLGISTYDAPDGGIELICVHRDGNLYKLVEGSVAIQFTATTTAEFLKVNIFVDGDSTSDTEACDFDPYQIVELRNLVTDEIVFTLYDNAGNEIVNESFGKGFDEAHPYLVDDLVTALNSASFPTAGQSITVSTTGNLKVPAAAIPIREETLIANGQTITLNFTYWQQLNHTVTATLPGLASKITSDEFENASFAPFSENLYICSRFDFPQKYDGQTVYRAGMPQGGQPSASVGAAGNPNGTYVYYVTYEQLDNTGRLVEGALSEASASITLSSEQATVTIDNLIAGSGWNTNCAIVNGAQASVNTIVVDAGHTIKVGDTAFLIDSGGNDVTREVTAITANSITIQGLPVSVDNNAVISNNLKINIYRQITNGGILLLDTVPNNSFSSTSTFTDNVANGSEGRRYADLPKTPAPPPKGAYVHPYNNLLMITGDPINDDFVWFSEPDEPENFPATNFFIVPANEDDVTGIGTAGTALVVAKDNSLYSVIGDIANDNFDVVPIAPGSNVGCVSHHTIQSIGELMYFLDGSNGVYCATENNLFPTDKKGNPVPISTPIDQFFRQSEKDPEKQLQLKRATAINYVKDNQYLLFIPSEDSPFYSSGNKYANQYSRTLVYDYQGKGWYYWNQWNAAGGFAVINDDLYFQERRKPASGDISANLYRQHRTYRCIDYVDHVAPIRVTLTTSWEDLQQPRVRKKFIRAVLLFDQESLVDQEPDFNLCFRTYLDWVQRQAHTRTTISTKNNAAPFSTYVFDWTQFSGTEDPFVTVSLRQGSVAKALQMRLQMKKLNGCFRLLGYQVEIAPIFRKTIVK